jgi:hypothetical protein
MELDDPQEIRRTGGWRRKPIARRWDVDVRTVDRKRKDGTLGEPAFFVGRIPVWTSEQLAAAERRPSPPRVRAAVPRP